jgi:hypothetical protein
MLVGGLPPSAGELGFDDRWDRCVWVYAGDSDPKAWNIFSYWGGQSS